MPGTPILQVFDVLVVLPENNYGIREEWIFSETGQGGLRYFLS